VAGDLDFPDLAEDIALEARLALALTDETKELDERIAVLLAQVDPAGIVRSAPGVGAITGAAILGRLGDPARFSSLAAARSFTGLVPSLDASGEPGRHGGPTKRGDAVLREALFLAADHARRIDLVGLPLSPADDRGRQAPHLGALPHRLGAPDPRHRLLAPCS
jgi:transposase